MILSEFEKPDSLYVWIQYRLHPKDKKKYSKSRVRKDDPDKKRKVQLALAQLQTYLLTQASEEAVVSESGWGWVPAFIEARWGRVERTHDVYRAHWRAVIGFLVEAGVRTPADLTRRHCVTEYVAWRTSQVKEKSKRNPGVNVAIDELKLLAMVMDEAVLRGFALENPARKLRLQRATTKIKPEFTDEQAMLVYRELQSRPVWMQRAFHMAMQTGLRFAETQIDLAGVSWADQRVFIGKPKGGEKRAFSIALYPTIVDLLREAERDGEPKLWSLPPKERKLVGLAWTKFFREIGLPNHSFHCTRVTFITRGMRAGIPESVMMKLVNHASKEVHRIYQRLRDNDGLLYHAKMALPQPPPVADAKPQSLPRRSSRRRAASPAL